MYGSNIGLKAPALSVPAILSFISLLSHLYGRTEYSMPLVPSQASPPLSTLLNTIGNEWELEWGRSTNLGTRKVSADKELSDAFRPGRYVPRMLSEACSLTQPLMTLVLKVYGRACLR